MIDMVLSVHLFYQQLPSAALENLQIPWEKFSRLINRLNPSAFESINSCLESIRPGRFVFPHLNQTYQPEIDIECIKHARETPAPATVDGGADAQGASGIGGGNPRRNRFRNRPPNRGRGYAAARGGRNFNNRR